MFTRREEEILSTAHPHIPSLVMTEAQVAPLPQGKAEKHSKLARALRLTSLAGALHSVETGLHRRSVTTPKHIRYTRAT